MELNNSTLHYVIIDTLLTHGRAPSVAELAERFDVSRPRVGEALHDLAEYHGVVLHPGSGEIWVVHPFSTAPTGFLVRAGEHEWWGNCAWCSLGVVELAGGTGTITTALGAAGPQVTVRIEDSRVLDRDYVVHFPIKMVNAWDNVLFTCSMMLLFESEAAVDTWCAKRSKAKGDVRPIEQVWGFAREWYGRHHDPDWAKWTPDEAAAMFARHDLTGPIWELPAGGERF
jgi:Alkylmercury lyase/Bacterial regulatory proteins, gntR family